MLNKSEIINAVNSIPNFAFKDVYVKGVDGNMHKTSFKVIVEENTNNVISIVTNKYKLIQFKDVYMPIIDSFQDCFGDLKYCDGVGIMLIFPDGESFVFDGANHKYRVGLYIINSVKSL